MKYKRGFMGFTPDKVAKEAEMPLLHNLPFLSLGNFVKDVKEVKIKKTTDKKVVSHN